MRVFFAFLLAVRNALPVRRVVNLLVALAALVVVIAIGIFVFITWFAEPILKRQVESDGFRKMLSAEVSKAIKVDGDFAQMTYNPMWAVSTATYRSTGWPGEAVGGLDADGISGTFDPWGILRRVWQLDLILIDAGTFTLREPDDALKRVPIKEPRPWYAVLMPQRFNSRWIECPKAQVKFPTGGQTGELKDIHLGAMMIGQNLKYFGKTGMIELPPLPPMAVDALAVLVTRQEVEVDYAYLREPDGPGTAELSGRLGQHDDKSIRADVKIENLDTSSMDLGDMEIKLDGRITANGTIATNKEGKDANGSGQLRWNEGVVRDWKVLDDLASKQENPDLRHFEFGEFSLEYGIKNGELTVDAIRIEAKDKLTLAGSATMNLDEGRASLDLEISELSLKAAAPVVYRDFVQGQVSGSVKWDWSEGGFVEGAGSGTLAVAGARLNGFDFQRFLARFLHDEEFLDLPVEIATLRWQYAGGDTVVEDVHLLAPNEAGVRGSVTIAKAGALRGTVRVGLAPRSLEWLPDAAETVFSRQEDGLLWATVTLSGTIAKPENDLILQIVKQLRKHPIAMAKLGARGLSWWIGDVLGTAPDQ